MYCFLGELVFRVESIRALCHLYFDMSVSDVSINVSGKSAYLLNHVGNTLQSNCHNLIIFPAWSSSVTSSVCYWFTFNRNTSLSFLSPWFSSPFTSTSASSREGLSIACALCTLFPRTGWKKISLKTLGFKQSRKSFREGSHCRAQGCFWSWHRQLTTWISSALFCSKNDCGIGSDVMELSLHCFAPSSCRSSSLLVENSSCRALHINFSVTKLIKN